MAEAITTAQSQNFAVLIGADRCNAYIGGKHKPKEKPMDAMVLASSIVSVRLNETGRPIRVFVDLKSNKVNNTSCF